jgi:hypothetical protein
MTMRPNHSPETTFGYLSAVETSEHGFFGGYLLISPLGRPLEFHCTAPVRPSRAQKILYGPTLEPYLLGEQIGGTLLGKTELKPKIILTDQPAALFLRSQSSAPLVQFVAGLANCDNASPECETASANSEPLSRRFELLQCEWELPIGFEADQPAVAELLQQLAKHVEVWEPFGRIHEAIREAQRIGSQGPNSNAQAA